MDRISYKIITSGEPGSEYLSEHCVRPVIMINDKLPTDHLLDVTALIFGGGAERSTFNLYTCSCGAPGCADFHIPLAQRRLGETVQWTIEDPKLSEVLGASKLIFETAAYDEVRGALLAELEAFEAKGLYAETMEDADYDEDGNRTLVYHRLADVAAHLLPYYHGQTELAETMEAAELPGDETQLRFSWGKPGPHYQTGVTPPEHFDLLPVTEVARCMLNIGDSLHDANRERGAALAEVAALMRDFAARRDTAAAEKAFAPFRRFLDEDQLTEPKSTFFFFDENGPFVRFP